MKPMTSWRFARLRDASLRRYKRNALVALQELRQFDLYCLKQHSKIRESEFLSIADKVRMHNAIDQEQKEALNRHQKIRDTAWANHNSIVNAAQNRLVIT